MREIKLTQGKVALVDDEDFERINSRKWQYIQKGYATTSFWVGDKCHHLSMHREVMHTPKGMVTDHIDHDKLNNQKANLRICSTGANSLNARPHKNATSKYKGVYIDIRRNKWKYYRAEICFKGKKTVKNFPFTEQGEISAALWYNEMAKELHGEFALLNQISK